MAPFSFGDQSMTLSAILVIAQILAAMAGADWSAVQIFQVIEKNGGLSSLAEKLEANGRDLLEILRGQATPPTLDQLKASNPDLHAQAVALLGAQGGAP